MATLQIRKKSLKTWLHIPSDADNFILSKFYCKTDANTFKIVEESGSNRREYSYTDITVYDDTAIGTAETFASPQALMLRLEELKYTGFNRDGDIPTSYIESVVAGTNVTIDNTDPLNPIISSTGGGGSQDLQDVTDNGATTTNSINVQLGNDYSIVNRDNVYTADDTNNSYAYIENSGTIAVNGGNFEGTIKATNLTVNNVNLEFPQKAVGSYTIATTDDLTPISQGIAKGTASGTDTYTTTITGVTSYADGDVYLIRFTNGNTTGCSLNINGLGAKTLYRNNDGALIGGDIVEGGEMLCVYNSTLNAFQCIGTAPNTLLAYVTNAEAITITKGQAVYVFGGTGDRITVKLANNTLDSTSAQTIGLVLSTSIGANQKGLVITQGQIDNLSLFPTSTWADGDFVYLGATDGSLTKVKPTAPNHLVYLGYVTTASNGSAGRMYVKVQNGYEVEELHNVAINSGTLANDDVLAYDFATSLWKNKQISQGTPLVRQEFSYTGSQTFTLSNTPSAIYAVFVNGQELNSSQYFFVTTTLTISDTLQSGDKINILYTPISVGVLDYYTKAQIDSFLLKSNIQTILGQASALNSGYLSFTDWQDFDAKQNAITLTTNNYSGNATFVGSTLNIPNYEGFIPKLRGHETFRGVNYSNNSTTEVTSGGITIATTGSTIARSVASTNYATKQIRKGFYGSVVSAGRYTGTRGSALLWYLGGGFKYVCDVYISDTAYGSGCRQFYGMIGQTSDLTYSDSVLVETMLNVIGVGSDALDTNLQVFHNDGSGVCTKVDLGVNFPANRTSGSALTTVYSIELYSETNASEVKYCVRNKETGDTAMGIISTNLPLSTQGLNFTASRCMGAGVTNTGQFDLLTLGVYSL